MKEKVLVIINCILASKGQTCVVDLNESTKLREDLCFTSFDLAELTVKIEDEFDIDIFEDGFVSTIGEIYAKLSK